MRATFWPRKSTVIERYQFHQRYQGNAEPFQQYVASLSELAATCNFGVLTDELIRDQLIEKTSIPRIWERLLMEDDGLTLEKATALAIQRESAMMDSKLIHTSPATSAPGMQQAPQLLTAHIQGLQTNRQPQLHPHPAHVPRQKPCQACGRQHGVKATMSCTMKTMQLLVSK